MKVTILSPTKSVEEGTAFYKTKEWKDLRKLFLSQQSELKCKCCGVEVVNVPKLLDIPEFKGKELANVDHILPVRYYWEDRLSIDNLQLLCKPCNKKKGNRHGPNILKEVLEEIKLDKIEAELVVERDQRMQEWIDNNRDLADFITSEAMFEYNIRPDYGVHISRETFIKEKLQNWSDIFYTDHAKYLRKVEHVMQVQKKQKNKSKNRAEKQAKKQAKKPIPKGNTFSLRPVDTKPAPRVHLVPKGTMAKKI